MYYMCDYVNLSYLKAVKTARDRRFCCLSVDDVSCFHLLARGLARAPVFDVHVHQNTSKAQ